MNHEIIEKEDLAQYVIGILEKQNEIKSGKKKILQPIVISFFSICYCCRMSLKANNFFYSSH